MERKIRRLQNQRGQRVETEKLSPSEESKVDPREKYKVLDLLEKSGNRFR